MKTRLLIAIVIIGIIFAGIFEISYADTDCDVSICVLESSWDGTQFVNPGETYWLKAQIQPDEKLDVKIFYYDDSIVHEKIYEPDEEGKVLIEYTSPKKEESLSFYRVAMMIEGDRSKTAGDVFRVGDTHPNDLFPVQTNSSLYNARIGESIQLESHNNDRWGMPLPPYYQFDVTLINPSGDIVYQNKIVTDEFGDFTDTITITEKGFYKLILRDDTKRQVRVFPLNFETIKIIHAEGKDFEITFGHSTREGIEFIIHDLIFDQQGKSLTIFVENPDEKNVRFDVKIPHEFLNGNMTTIVDDMVRDDIEQEHILNYSSTFFLLESGNHTVQIIGTSAIPEFETITAMILAVSILPIIFVSRRKRK